MKEKVTLRLYEHPDHSACCEMSAYIPDDAVRGWDFNAGDQIGLHEKSGGFLMAGIERVDPQIRTDSTGRYKLATAWTLD